jgi:phosphatidylglycerol:prolipoprotein diacylglycerol transferase
MSSWNHIYESFDPVAFSVFSLSVHWYGIMYVLALLVAIWAMGYFVKKDALPIEQKALDSFIIYAEIGVILGARLGFVLFYDTHTNYYLTHPWQMFNPFLGGTFVGIRGMSYHGAMIGFLVATLIFSYRHKIKFWFLMDLAAIAIPFGYIFGRIGNFLNQELIGRETSMQIGIYVGDVLRHPSQLYEALLEGVLIAIVLYWYRTQKRFDGELIVIYTFLYGLACFVVEFVREPDIQLGFICCDVLTMGQILSLLMIGVAVVFYFILQKRARKKDKEL